MHGPALPGMAAAASLGLCGEGERQFIRFSQIWFQSCQVCLGSELRDMGYSFPIHANLDKDRMVDTAVQMDDCSQSISHYDEVGEDSSGTKEHVSLTCDNFDGSK